MIIQDDIIRISGSGDLGKIQTKVEALQYTRNTDTGLLVRLPGDGKGYSGL